MPNFDVSSYDDPTSNKLIASASNDPTQAIQWAQGRQQLQQGQVKLDQQTYDLAKSKFNSLRDVAKSIALNPTLDNVGAQGSLAVQGGLIDADTMNQVSAHMMTLGGDPQKIKGFAMDVANTANTNEQLLDQAYGKTQQVNTGGSLVTENVRQPSGSDPGGTTVLNGSAPIATTLSPAEKTGGLTVANPDGSKSFRSNSDIYDNQGNFKSIPVTRNSGSGTPQGGAGQGAAAPAPVLAAPAPQTSPVRNSAMPGTVGDSAVMAARQRLAAAQDADPSTLTPAQQQQLTADTGTVAAYRKQQATPFTTPQGSGQGGAPAAQPMLPVAGSDSSLMARPASSVQPNPSPVSTGVGLTTALSPGQEASLQVGADTYKALTADVSSPNGSPQRVFQLTRALDAVRNTQTGRGTQTRQEMLGYLDALPGGLGKMFPGIDPASLTNYDLAGKYMNAIAMSAPGAARSDAGLATAASANASTNGMTQQAAIDVLTNGIGQERLKQAQVQAFNASGQDPGTFSKWATQWGQGVDPRAFALGAMTPQERASLYGGLKGPAKAAFLTSVKKGLSARILSATDLQGASGNGQ